MSVLDEIAEVARAGGDVGVTALIAELRLLKPRSPVEAVVHRGLLEVMEERGPDLVQHAVWQVREFLEAPETVSEARGFLSLSQRSDVLATLQIAEGESRAQALEWLSTLGTALGRIFIAALKVGL